MIIDETNIKTQTQWFHIMHATHTMGRNLN